ncbi:MAG: HEAT repeat domain-containing protein [Nitrososphaera sp.]|nr:HEAT repeat domain-containing protein [Nitrososphaera sp.]
MKRACALAYLIFSITVPSALTYVRADGQLPTRPAITFDLVTRKVSLHEPIYVEFVLNNNSADSISLDLGDNRKGAFQFAITPPNGERTKVPPLIKRGEGIVGSGKLTLSQGEVYLQRLLVNEWYKFTTTGKYLVELDLPVRLTTKSGTTFTVASRLREELEITAKDVRRLDAVCNEITQRSLTAKNLQESVEEATALAYILDPIAVPYLEKLLRANRMLDHVALFGLARIGDSQAIQVLLSALNMEDKETAIIAAQKLSSIKSNVSDPVLRKKIEQALITFTGANKR